MARASERIVVHLCPGIGDFPEGDVLIDREGQPQTVLTVSQRYEPEFLVSNLTIGEFHNFAVGQEGILVHNVSLCEAGEVAMVRILRGLDEKDAKWVLEEVGVDPEQAARILAQSRLPKPAGVADEPFGGKAAGNAPNKVGIIAQADEALSPLAKQFPDAKVGFRGSLARGTKGPHKGGGPFDPTDFDVDAFIVSDELAAAIPKDRNGFRNLGRIAEHRSLIESISTKLRSIAGHRNEPVKFRVFSTEEFLKLAPDEVHLLP